MATSRATKHGGPSWLPTQSTELVKLHGGHLEVTRQLKTSRSRRSLDAPPQLIELLCRHRTQQIADRLEVGPAWSSPDDLVFTNSLGGPIDPANLRRSLRRVTEEAGLGPGSPTSFAIQWLRSSRLPVFRWRRSLMFSVTTAQR